MVTVLPFGEWPSPLSPADVGAAKVSRSDLRAGREGFYWLESRPLEGGRTVLRAGGPGLAPRDVSPPGADIRSRVHEYGGGAFCVVPAAGDLGGERLAFVDRASQRVVLFEPEGPGQLLGAAPPAGERWALGDLAATADGRWVLAVRERLADGTAGGPGPSDRAVVAVATDGPGPLHALAAPGDFVAAPRPSPDGRWLACVAWDDPAMPWDRSSVWLVALGDGGGRTLGPPRRVAGGGEVSVGEPRWGRDGSLYWVDDATGWWQPVRLSPEGVEGASGEGPRRLCDVPAEFHGPDWALGQSSFGVLEDGRLVCRWRRAGVDQLGLLDPAAAVLEPFDQPCVSIGAVAVLGGERAVVAWLGRTPDGGPPLWSASAARPTGTPRGPGAPPVVGRPLFEAGPGGTAAEVRPAALASASVSTGRDVRFVVPKSKGRELGEGSGPGLEEHEAFARFFEPRLEGHAGPPGRRPPLVVVCHGGPTGCVEAGFDPLVQFFTTRGYAVAAVDFGGSTGYGRAYRRSLDGWWGVLDALDCVACARHLAADGLVDGTRMVIRGTSAGGMTALNALRHGGVFAAATAWYPVTDLATLSSPGHPFEAHYTEGLVGRLPEAAERYRWRSPVNGAAEMTGAVLLCQGLDDPVVPPSQAEALAAALSAAGRPCRLLRFEGEAHGFRRAETVTACLEAELAFYREVLPGR